MRLRAALSLAALVALASPSQAQDPDSVRVLTDVGAAFALADRDGDGEIAFAELERTAAEADSSLSAAGEDPEARMEVLGKYMDLLTFEEHLVGDTNGDLALDREELTSFLWQRDVEQAPLSATREDCAQIARATVGRYWPGMIARTDQNGDGAIGREELLAAGLENQLGMFDQNDGNKDGILTRTELETAFEADLRGRYGLD